MIGKKPERVKMAKAERGGPYLGRDGITAGNE